MIHKSAFIEDNVEIGDNTNVWHNSQVRKGTKIGKNCVLAKNVFIDYDTEIGNNVKIQNNVSIYHKAIIEDGVFIGPHVCFTNDKVPRAINPDGTPKGCEDWETLKLIVRKGASIGANSTILPGIKIGEWSLIAAGSVVSRNVPDYGLVMGIPAKLVGFVCFCGFKLSRETETDTSVNCVCKKCLAKVNIPLDDYQRLIV